MCMYLMVNVYIYVHSIVDIHIIMKVKFCVVECVVFRTYFSIE